MFMVFILGIVYIIDAFKEKTIPTFVKSVLILMGAVLIAIGVNATSLLATQEYAQESTRSKSELTINPDGTSKENITSGLTKEYITEYSYGTLETFNLLIPRFYGGGSRENLGKQSETYNFLKDKIGRAQAKDFSENLPAYWGKQTFVEAPAYIGAVLIFLFVLGLFSVRGKLKKWLLAATIFSILMSWGKNFPGLTNFFIDYVPLYNKFRAVSSIQVIVELAVPLLAIITLNQFLQNKNDKTNQLKYLKYTFYVVGGLTLLFTLLGGSLFSFESLRDTGIEQQLPGFRDAIIADRKSLMFNDSMRSFILVLMSAGFLWMFIKKMINKNVTILLFAILILFDLVAVDKRYVNEEDFVSKREIEKPFQASIIDKEILKDKSHYRVINWVVNPMNDGSTSYFHNSIGGYHAAKPRRYQELFDYQIAKNNIEVWNMLHTKYIIYPDNEGEARLQQNMETNGNAWFVNEVVFVETADEEIMGLDSLKTKEKAIINASFKTDLNNSIFKKDSLDMIKLVSYQPNEIKYESKTSDEQLAVFSEMYYKKGWNAYLDGTLVPHVRANYVLRAMTVPSGEHEIIFKFEPAVIKKGNTVTLISFALLFLIPISWFFMDKKNRNVS